jgi:hypothetical protein
MQLQKHQSSRATEKCHAPAEIIAEIIVALNEEQIAQ